MCIFSMEIATLVPQVQFQLLLPTDMLTVSWHHLIPFSVARDSDMPQGCVIELFTAENGIKLRGYYNDIDTDGAFCSNQYQCICLSGRCATCFAETYSLDGNYRSNVAAVPTGKQLLVYLDRLNAKTIITVCQVLV